MYSESYQQGNYCNNEKKGLVFYLGDRLKHDLRTNFLDEPTLGCVRPTFV
jgi:hypothetical protein